MKRLLKYLKAYKFQCVMAPLFKMLEALFELFVPLVMADIIDKGISGRDISLIIRSGIILFGLAAVGLVCSVTAQYFSAKAATEFAGALRSDLFKHIQSLAYLDIDKLGTAGLVTKLTADTNQVQNGVNMVLRLFLRSPFIVFGAMLMAFTIDVRSALIFVVAIPLLTVTVMGIMALTLPLYRKIQIALDEVLAKTRENLNGVRVIRAFNKEDEELLEFNDKNNRLSDLQLVTGKISALTNPVTFIIVNAATIILIYTGAVQVDTGIITQGEVVALVNYMSQILVELIKLANLIVTVTRSLACANRIADVFEIKSGIPVIKSGDVAADCSICFEHVGLAYSDTGEEALTDICTEIKKGDTVGIIGSTGSGKSSLVNLIPRFYDITSGSLRIGGTEVSKLDVTKLRSMVGMVPQKSVLFKGSIRENMLWGKEDATDEEIWQALRAAQAEDFVKEKKGGLDYKIAQNGRNMSGGQKQRLNIARALVRKPGILILDDSSSALDYGTDLALRNAIAALDDAMTVIIVSQRTASIREADHIIVLEDGHIAGQGTHEQLLAQCEVYQEIYYSQSER